MKNHAMLTSAAALIAAAFATTSYAQDDATSSTGLTADAEMSTEAGSAEAGAGLEGSTDTTDGLATDVEAEGSVTAGTEDEGASTDPMAAEGTAETETESVEGETTDLDAGTETGTDTELDTGTGMEADTETGMDAEAETGMDAEAETGTTEMSSDDEAKLNYGSLISTLRSGSDASVDLETIDDTAEIETVKLSEFQGEAASNAKALDKALESNAEELAATREAVSANATIGALLEAEGFTADDVIAVSSDADGAVQIIVDDRES